MTQKLRVLSGLRPSGKLHLGNLLGALDNFRAMQDQYDCFYFSADNHALTTEYSDPSLIREWTFDNMVDLMAAGISPEKATIFIQSWVPAHAELTLLFSFITPIPWLERVPTYKQQIAEIEGKDLTTIGFLQYPLMQAADILIYRANLVPVGEDQLFHIELTREVARRFNHLYGKEILPEPQAKLTEFPKLLGIDNRKMSKSYNNSILLSDSPEFIRQKVMQMITDPARKTKKDPGNPEICNVYSYHKFFSSKEQCEMVNEECRKAGIGCVEDKKMLADNLVKYLEPHQQRRKELLTNKNYVMDVLKEGSKKANQVANQTMETVKEAMGLLRSNS